jgi:hypothetical protein
MTLLLEMVLLFFETFTNLKYFLMASRTTEEESIATLSLMEENRQQRLRMKSLAMKL